MGCGAGLTTAALAQHGFEIEALDSVPAMLDLTRHRLLETGTEARVRTTCADVRHLPFPDNNFDLVFALGVVMWVDPPFGAIQQMARVTRPGGYVLITAMHDHTWLSLSIHGRCRRLGAFGAGSVPCLPSSNCGARGQDRRSTGTRSASSIP